MAELLAHAHAMEAEAVERYAELAEQMEVHNNREVAELFRRMAEVEARHVARVRDRAAGIALPRLAPWQFVWRGAEAPEAIDATDAHYLMTPWHALRLALVAEQRGFRFYADLAATAVDAEVRALAAELADEEQEHVGLMRQWLARYRKPEAGWNDDPDPPVAPD